MRRERMRRRRRHVAIAQLLEQRQEARAQIGQRDGVPARGERALGAQQQPGAGGVEPFDPGRVDNDGMAGRHLQRAQPPVEFRGFGHEPIARGSQDQRSRLLGGNNRGGGRHAEPAEPDSLLSDMGQLFPSKGKPAIPQPRATCSGETSPDETKA